MNTKLTALTLVAAAAFAFTPKPAVAGDKGLAVVGGLIGGLIIASAINDHHDTDAIYVSDRYNDGYWNTVSVNVWVPGYWVVERSHYGRSHRYYVAGHYECRNDRVWVANNRYDRYDRHDRGDDRRDRRNDRSDRDHGRSYGYDRRDRSHR